LETVGHFSAVVRFNQVSEYILAHNATCRRNENAAIIPGLLVLPSRITCLMVLYIDKVFSFALLDDGAAGT
jgi:hypothetical protein